MSRIKSQFLSACTIFLVLSFSHIFAKEKFDIQHKIFPNDLVNSKTAVISFEQRFTPFFRSKTSKAFKIRSDQYPNDFDLMMIAKLWDNLSPEFRKMYLEATAIPDDFQFAISPGGHFEVYYTSNNINGVDTTDLYKYGIENNWRTRINISNGVPDYVDEVCWALDSGWNMEVSRLGFLPPIPKKDYSYPSDRYKVIITNQSNNQYGVTYPQGKQLNSERGYSSIIEITNAWPSSIWAASGYDKYPELAVRVTAVHELFHAIQYTMTWNVERNIYLDDFPVVWLEGTSVLMEELAFDSINDYLQYAMGYFDKPTLPLLDSSRDNVDPYSSSIITKFLYEQVAGSQIDFIKNVFELNYNQLTPFHNNLCTISIKFGIPWERVLNWFHTESFFSGARSVKGRFLVDAPLFPAWTYTTEQALSHITKTVSVNGYGMSAFGLTPNTYNKDTVHVSFLKEDDAANQWALSFILRQPKSADSIIYLNSSDKQTDTFVFPQWKKYSEVITIISNGCQQSLGNARITFDMCQGTIHRGETIQVKAISSDTISLVKAIIKAKTELPCGVSTYQILNDSAVALFKGAEMSAVSSVFCFDYPKEFIGNSEIEFSLGLAHSNMQPFNSNVYNDTYHLFRFNYNKKIWVEVSSERKISGDTLYWLTVNESAGIYALCRQRLNLKAVDVFPNVVHLSSNKAIRIQGENITNVAIYSISGKIICSTMKNKNTQSTITEYPEGYLWFLTNNTGQTVVPGTYAVIITKKSSISKRSDVFTKKVLITP